MQSIASVLLREVIKEDVAEFFQHQLDERANHMAAFTAEDPNAKDVFDERWTKILANDAIEKRTVLFDGKVSGHLACFERFGKPEVCYWFGKQYWGKGLATAALAQFLDVVKVRPLYARVATDNLGSIRVLEKCGFKTCGHDKGFAHARGQEIEEVILQLP